ncbi:MAG TPA: hypothetical protein DEP36_17015 [Gammaproteobacteria bacterium]|nr:hypothetical protein [Gammaproteobacteria bacterium]
MKPEIDCVRNIEAPSPASLAGAGNGCPRCREIITAKLPLIRSVKSFRLALPQGSGTETATLRPLRRTAHLAH